MKKIAISLVIFVAVFLLTGCASVGPSGVEITENDTVWTVLGAIGAFIAVWWSKTWLEFYYARRLEDHKHQLEKDKKDT